MVVDHEGDLPNTSGCPSTSITRYQVSAFLGSLPGKLGRIAAFLGNTNLPIDLVLSKNVVERIQDRLIPPGCGIDDHMNMGIRWILH
jgi:hypothetical protein